jgi:hypothetical protein
MAKGREFNSMVLRWPHQTSFVQGLDSLTFSYLEREMTYLARVTKASALRDPKKAAAETVEKFDA